MTDPKLVTVNYLLLVKLDNATVVPADGVATECIVDKLRSSVCEMVKNDYVIRHRSLKVFTTEDQTIYISLRDQETTVEDQGASLTAVTPKESLYATKYYILVGSATPVGQYQNSSSSFMFINHSIGHTSSNILSLYHLDDRSNGQHG